MLNFKERRVQAGLLSLALVMSACSGSTATPSSEVSTDSTQASAVEADAGQTNEGVTRFEGHPETLPLVSGLIPELADLPVPDGAAFHPGSANTASQDPRETAVQRVDFLLEASEVVEFYLEQMPALGYTAASGSYPQDIAELEELTESGVELFVMNFDGPDGIPVQLTISSGVPGFGGNSTMNINRFRAGFR